MVQVPSSLNFLRTLNVLVGARAACVGPDVNQATLDLVEEFEGFRAEVYVDPTGNPTVGYGHLCKQSGCSDVPCPIPLSDADGEKLLREDIKVAQQCITLDTTSEVALNENHYGALVSWSFNVGCNAADGSILIRRLNNGEDANTVAGEELPKWKKGNGKPVAGLAWRRAEVELFKTSTDAGALPVGC
ncbi:hypothetical protein FZEAL_2082 [Fusarium zealandicum]|uniref:Lysozyme n=1 Tax=Fusarium zealandicum TaxID=1053134 RepID=A0A8H4US21_9HYPO|nr:hypothetical protein FZEAL_2082 [Fusarium zealandicum]